MKTIVFVSVLVIRPAAAGRPGAPAGWEFLQILRSPGRYMEGTWQLVSGGIEENEPAWRAALRELREETSLAPLELYHLDHVSTFYLPHLDTLNHAIAFCAVVAPHANVVLNDEHLDSRWTPQDQIESALMWSGQRAACAEVLREIIGNGPSKLHCRIELP
jgi:dihydroneopterin triphosphate diphosphatase